MKVIATTLLAAAASLPLATHAVISHARTSTPFLSQKSKQARGTTFLNVPRGGDLGPIKGSTLAKTFGVLAIGDGLAGTLAPVEVWDKFGIKIERGSKGEHYLGHGLASSATSLAVTSLLALTGKTSAEAAIGYGFLARCAYMTDSLLTGTYKELGVPTVPHVVIYLILLGTAFGLISGNANYVDLAKVVSLLLAGHGGLLLVNPRTDGKFGIRYIVYTYGVCCVPSVVGIFLIHILLHYGIILLSLLCTEHRRR